MLHRNEFCIIVFLACIITSISIVSGEVWNIPEGGTVFISEEGLDLTATGITNGSQIGWWGAGQSTVSSPPDATVIVVDATYFTVSSILFEGKTGPWYVLPNRSLAIVVDDSRTSIRVFDETAGIESTDAWVPRGDVVSFRLDTNLYQMNERPGVEGASMILHLKAPSGARYKALIGPDGSSTTITDITVPSSAYSTGPIWDTGNALYKQGIYSIYAETDAESSDTVTFLLQDVNPLLTSGAEVEIQAGTITITPTAVPTVIPTATTDITRMQSETIATRPANNTTIKSGTIDPITSPLTTLMIVQPQTITTQVPDPLTTDAIMVNTTGGTSPTQPGSMPTSPAAAGFEASIIATAGIIAFCLIRRR